MSNPIPYRQSPSFVDRLPLRTAYLCSTCLFITNCAPHGVCRFCGSSAVRAVAALLLSVEERQAWIDLVRGQIKMRLSSKTQPLAPEANIALSHRPRTS